ncbi:hypothetical protein GGR88_001828 [Sphingomonas jejuensis]|jgi:hypothetical protein|uniref:Uncharacterized protein n=1 Tax=Sphingomonas jejuensis TaxID=904715 RepID=A0ABX0XM94_9SPHN|nr:hypothetical protein [Sphingomonas jejuensis]NJC34354.1 hypothetical protein [Sphingomonas jejuensis]
MAAIAIIIFVGLFSFGGEAFGWVAYEADVRLALFLTFVLGIICGMRVKS